MTKCAPYQIFYSVKRPPSFVIGKTFLIGGALFWAVLAAAPGFASAAYDQDPGARCEALTEVGGRALGNPTATVISAKLQAATGELPPDYPSQFYDPIAPLPTHCEIYGRLNERVGIDGQAYAVNFHMRLPVDWNGRFFFQGGAGSNGIIGNAVGYLQGRQTTHALGLGYAVVTNDGGHDMVANNDPERSGLGAFGWDPQARREYGGAALGDVTTAAKSLITAFYGRGPQYSYFVGCSKGGQEGMMVAEHLPEEFDGVLANAPAMNIPKTTHMVAIESQRFARLARKNNQVGTDGDALIGNSFSDADLALVSQSILAACDGKDGVVDGIVSNLAACKTRHVRKEFAKITCTGTKTEACLSPDQIDVLLANNADTPVTPWPWDAGIGGEKNGGGYYDGWRFWKIGAAGAVNSGVNVTLVGPLIASLLTSPPVALADKPATVMNFLETLDIRDAARFGAGGHGFAAADDYLVTDQFQLSKFRARGGKFISLHGASDPIFSMNDTINWWRRLKGQKKDVQKTVRVYAVPGMAHCTGGPTTDDVNAFAALVAWVEQNTVPDRLVAKARAASPWPGRTRPLCPYPAYAHYKGHGSIEDAENFECR